MVGKQDVLWMNKQQIATNYNEMAKEKENHGGDS